MCGARPEAELVGGRYRLLNRVGAGGMANVYRARDGRLPREVAVKVIAESLAHDPLFVRRFRREAKLCAGLAHPNIVAVLDAGVEPRDFIVMELVSGVDAGALLRTRERLTPEQTVHVVSQVCEALAYAHEQGVVHRDVSPRNILMSQPEGAVKLADFGLGSSDVDLPATRVPSDMGTPGYVAPEIVGGAAPSARSDLYSLGMVAHRLLAGRPRARPRDPEATTPRATAAPRVLPLADHRPDVPPALTEAVRQATAFEPDRRQESVAEFRAQLIEGLGVPVRLRRARAAHLAIAA